MDIAALIVAVLALLGAFLAVRRAGSLAAWSTEEQPGIDPQMQTFMDAFNAASGPLFQAFQGSGGHYYGAPSGGPAGTW